MLTIGIDDGAESAPARVVRRADGAVVGYPFDDKGVSLDESDHALARQAPVDLAGDLRLPIGARGAVR